MENFTNKIPKKIIVNITLSTPNILVLNFKSCSHFRKKRHALHNKSQIVTRSLLFKRNNTLGNHSTLK